MDTKLLTVEVSYLCTTPALPFGKIGVFICSSYHAPLLLVEMNGSILLFSATDFFSPKATAIL